MKAFILIYLLQGEGIGFMSDYSTLADCQADLTRLSDVMLASDVNKHRCITRDDYLFGQKMWQARNASELGE